MLELYSFIIPPLIIVGSKSAHSSNQPNKDVVVVLPWVPLMVKDTYPRIIYDSISERCMMGIFLALASII